MNNPQLIAVHPAAAVAAGRSTAGSAEVWAVWARRCANAFTEAGQAVHNARIELAGTAYATRVVIGANQVGQRVEGLGDSTVAAATVVHSADLAAAGLLRRPVTGERAAV